MSYYVISTLIIVVTSLVTFYLLYVAKELNLGILISILLGSIMLGVTFLPVFKSVMIFSKEIISISKFLAFIISILSIFVIFLTFTLVISFIISITIPNKLIAIDCCAMIERTVAKMKHGHHTQNIIKIPYPEQKIDAKGIEKNLEVNNDNNLEEIPGIIIQESKRKIPVPEAKISKLSTVDVNAAKALVLKALQKKGDNKKAEAIECYLKALQQQPDSEMIFWIVIDVCALYKQLGLNELAKSILESLSIKYGNVIRPEVKKEIMNCLY